MGSVMTSAASAFAREDTLFGICFALGEDFGFNPLYLRLLFGSLLLVIPVEAIGAYGACGVLVAVVRRLVPEPRPVDCEPEEREEELQVELPLAA
jgi:phage shock protein PspC (stress-responsive transcriptional regulator)